MGPIVLAELPNNNTITVTSGGNVGIGVPSPGARLDVGAGSPSRAGYTNLLVGGSGVAGGSGIAQLELYGTSKSAAISYDGTNVNFWVNGSSWVQGMVISNGGNVGIGTTNPQYLLSVKGTVGAQEFIVTNTGWSDYVFRPDYRLRPLSEVSQYIQANGHLPDIPTEAEVKEKGVSIGDMQAKLLAKVEELTLHMIQQEKDNRELRDKMNEQTKEIQELRERLAKSAATDSTPAVAK